MKVLYAIQSTGNGHISRAKEIIPYLERRFNLDIMLSGPKNHLDLGYPNKNHFQGLTLHFNKSGSINQPGSGCRLSCRADRLNRPVDYQDRSDREFSSNMLW